MPTNTLDIPTDRLADFCRRWKIRDLSMFGSMARGEARPESDIDLLVTFEEEAAWGLLEHAAMELELEAMLLRPVDLVSRRGIERSGNPIRRRAILRDARSVYRAA